MRKTLLVPASMCVWRLLTLTGVDFRKSSLFNAVKLLIVFVALGFYIYLGDLTEAKTTFKSAQ